MTYLLLDTICFRDSTDACSWELCFRNSFSGNIENFSKVVNVKVKICSGLYTEIPKMTVHGYEVFETISVEI